MIAPRIPGLAHGWEGGAWTHLERIAAGLAEWTPGFRRRLVRDLRAVAAAPASASPSPFIGHGGAVTVAANAAEIDPSLAPLADDVVAQWATTDCDSDKDDLFLGHPGALLALGELASRRAARSVPGHFVQLCHRRTVAALRTMLTSDRPHFLGLAHGLAGLLLALECGAARLGLPRDRDLVDRAIYRLVETRAIAPGLGAIWTPRTGGDLSSAAGSWCHGAAGIALALHGCYRLSGDPDYGALFDEVVGPLRRLRSPSQIFCCGRAGRAHVLVELYRQTGDTAWLSAARDVVAEPTPPQISAEYPAGFHQGRLGIRYLAARLRHPDALGMFGTGLY